MVSMFWIYKNLKYVDKIIDKIYWLFCKQTIEKSENLPMMQMKLKNIS